MINSQLRNQFLVIWYQSLDAWIIYLYRQTEPRKREAFRLDTIHVLQRFIEILDNINFEEIDNNDLDGIFEEESKSSE